MHTTGHPIIQLFTSNDSLLHNFAEDVKTGLKATPKRLSSKYFYDDKGSKIFQEIMGLEAYYLTNCEYEILDRYGKSILAYINDTPFNIIDMGAGDGKKTRLLIQAAYNQNIDFHYIPIDISTFALEDTINRFDELFPEIKQTGVVAEYQSALSWINENIKGKKLVLFLGSNIGNFSKSECLDFLSSKRAAMQTGDHLLIGFDLKKDPEIIKKAYDDESGVTARFNLNLLNRINEELNADFAINLFKHKIEYNEATGRLKSYLVSQVEQDVYIEKLKLTIHFDKNETIHTENSHKYSLSAISGMAESTGFKIKENFFDSKKYFTDSLWVAQ